MSCSTIVSGGPICRASDNHHRFWYAAYTRSRHEKVIAQYLLRKDLQCFLPLHEAVGKRPIGSAHLQIPLFPGYVFVHIYPRELSRVLQTPGVVRFISTGIFPAVIPEEEIEAVRRAVNSGRVEAHPFLVAGARVRISRGPLQGMEGIVVSHKGMSRVILSLNLIMRSVSVEIDTADLLPLETVNSGVQLATSSSMQFSGRR
jgi:transcription antitermination factor NusG